MTTRNKHLTTALLFLVLMTTISTAISSLLTFRSISGLRQDILKTNARISDVRTHVNTDDIFITNVPVSEKGTHHYSQGGIVVDGIAYFTADHTNMERGDNYRKSSWFPCVVSFSTDPPFKKIRTYAFKDTYDSSPLFLTTKEGISLLIAHEHTEKRTKAINAKTGNTEWVSEANQPGHLFIGFSYYSLDDGSKIILAAASNGLHAMNLRNGKEIWHLEKVSTGGVTPSVDQDNHLVYYQYDGGLAKVDARTGYVIKDIRVAAPNNTISWNTVLIDDEYGYYIATYWYGKPEWDSAVRVYNKELTMQWEHSSLSAGKKATLTYANGKLITGIGNGWSEKYFGNDWKRLRAWSIKDGATAWETDLSQYGFCAIYNIPYFNGSFYAETQDIHGFSSKLFRIHSQNGTIESVLDYGRPITSCAPPLIANGMMFSGDFNSDRIIVTRLASGSEADWKGPFGDPQTNHNATPDENNVMNVPMEEITAE